MGLKKVIFHLTTGWNYKMHWSLEMQVWKGKTLFLIFTTNMTCKTKPSSLSCLGLIFVCVRLCLVSGWQWDRSSSVDCVSPMAVIPGLTDLQGPVPFVSGQALSPSRPPALVFLTTELPLNHAHSPSLHSKPSIRRYKLSLLSLPRSTDTQPGMRAVSRSSLYPKHVLVFLPTSQPFIHRWELSVDSGRIKSLDFFSSLSLHRWLRSNYMLNDIQFNY